MARFAWRCLRLTNLFLVFCFSFLAVLARMRSVDLSVNVRDDLRGQWAGSHKSAIWGLYL